MEGAPPHKRTVSLEIGRAVSGIAMQERLYALDTVVHRGSQALHPHIFSQITTQHKWPPAVPCKTRTHFFGLHTPLALPSASKRNDWPIVVHWEVLELDRKLYVLITLPDLAAQM